MFCFFFVLQHLNGITEKAIESTFPAWKSVSMEPTAVSLNEDLVRHFSQAATLECFRQTFVCVIKVGVIASIIKYTRLVRVRL